MTDELTSEQEAAVRRLLAEARHDAPLPADVAARLDGVLDGLAADDGVDDLEGLGASESVGSGSVTELAGVRQRRRNAGRLLLAAAAVVIGGVAVGQMLGGTGLDEGSDSDSAGDNALAEPPRASSSRAEEEAAGGGEAADSAAPLEEDAPDTTSSGGSLMTLRAPLALTSDNFAADVQRELLRTADERRHAAKADYDGVAAYAQTDPDFMCAAGPYGQGATLPAYYDAEEAVLVLRRPRANIQRVDLLTCGTAVTLNSVELPAP